MKTLSITTDIRRQTIDIEHPTYDTAVSAFASASYCTSHYTINYIITKHICIPFLVHELIPIQQNLLDDSCGTLQIHHQRYHLLI